jgi:hypothetical protein
MSAHREAREAGRGPYIVSTVRTRSEDTRRLVVESVAFGLGYTAVLIWGGSALVAAFSPYEAYPYWPAIPHLRTDTSGVLAFMVSLVCLTVSKYLELRRRASLGDTPVKPVARPAGVLAVQAVAEAAVVCASGLVIYLSLNAVVHPWTLRLRLTHLWPWPSEGTVRVIGLAVCLIAVATRRYLRATASRPSEAGPAATDPAVAGLAAADPAVAGPPAKSAAENTVKETDDGRVAVPPIRPSRR